MHQERMAGPGHAELVDQNQQFRLCSECLVKVMMSFQHGCGMHPDFHVDMITLAADQKMGWQREVGKQGHG